MSIAASAWAKVQRTGSAARKALLMILADYASVVEGMGPRGAGSRHYAWPGVERLADQSEQSERSVMRHLEELEALGLVARERRHDRDGRRMSDWIILAVDDSGPCPFPTESPEDEDAEPSTVDKVTDRQVTDETRPGDNRDTGTYIRTTNEPPTTGAPAEAVADEGSKAPTENAGDIVSRWIDWLKDRSPSVIMPRALIPRLGKEIKSCLDSGIDPTTVKHGLALMYERGKAHSPSLVPSFVAEVQMARSGAGRPAPATRHAKPLHQKRDEHTAALKAAGAYLEEQGVDTESREGGKLVLALAEEILARPDGLASMNGVDTRIPGQYIQGEVINAQRAIGGAAQ